ncbi:MAG: 2-oxoacid:acceptor oxidoreductase family protein [candidate division Zixibacteria bacterium]|nr:2-oxoacid:acceptor oxidoreductase family protein [candidate division Zixibacteria bacterium]MBU1470068.1 2-oxoacid:acceptor oxidoreductase family protein [candidate division Zixibacteria bacterium]MBU2624388.1 2-oxoacid:acceptor oxidoreductase family protein [candidate division Zixibacteria bacterium]
MIIRFVGFGGQGIVMSSYIVGQSAVFDGKKAVQNQSYGSESRGGECRGDVIISDTDIYELEPSKHDVLVSMTQPGYEKFISDLKPGGILICDKDLVLPDSNLNPQGIREYGISATDIASRKFGRKIVANMVILGYMNSILQLVTSDALAKAISLSVPKGTEDLNLDAMREGMALAEQEN